VSPGDETQRRALPDVGQRGYHCCMVDPALLNQVLRLDAASRREFVSAVERSLDRDDIPENVLAEVDARLAEKGVEPDPEAISADEFISKVRALLSA
jgi:DNA primase catalytic subunit